MPKKIYDILPPKLANKTENTAKSFATHEKSHGQQKLKKPKKSSPIILDKKDKRFPLKEILIGGGVILILLSIYLYNKLPKAQIQILPRMEQVSQEEKIVADKSIGEVDIIKKVIPAYYAEETQDSWQEFQSTGIVSNDKKATGSVKIYNKLDSLAPLTLIKGTHFLSDSGKSFVIVDRVIIPSAQYQKGKLVPGSVTAKVEAKEAGEDYNIGNSKFSVPKLSGTVYYYSIYAESSSPMVGGYVGNVKKVTKDDIQKAQDDLTEKLLEQAEVALKNKLTPDDILIDDSVVRDIISFSSTIKQDTIIDKFGAEAKVKVSGLIFKKQDLEKFVKDSIVAKLPQNNSVLETSLDINYNPGVIDNKNGKVTLDLDFSAKVYQDINTQELVELFSLQTTEEIKEIVNSVEYSDKISEAKITFWPFWVKKAPKNKDRIVIDLVFE